MKVSSRWMERIGALVFALALLALWQAFAREVVQPWAFACGLVVHVVSVSALRALLQPDSATTWYSSEMILTDETYQPHLYVVQRLTPLLHGDPR